MSNTWVVALAIFVVTRLFVLAGAYAGASDLIHRDPTYSKGWMAEASLMWDASFYWNIAHNGYVYDPGVSGGSNVSFAPLYPFVVSVVERGVRAVSFGWDWGNSTFGPFIVAGLLVSNLCFLGAIALLILWLRPRMGMRGASLVALGMASLPTAFFYSAIYTESMFLLLALAAFLPARSELRWKWLCVGLLAMLATLSRFTGVILLPVLAVEYMSQRNWNWRKVRPDVLWLGLIPGAVLLFMGFLWWRFGDPLAMNKSMLLGWNHQLSFFPITYWNSLANMWNSLLGHYAPGQDAVLYYGMGSRLYMWLDLLLPPVLLLGAFAARKRILASEWVWLALGIVYPLSFNITFSMSRYVAPLWPGLAWLGSRGRIVRIVAVVMLLISLVLMMVSTSRYAGARWIG